VNESIFLPKKCTIRNRIINDSGNKTKDGIPNALGKVPIITDTPPTVSA
jgi:hypothetical protein